MAKATVSAETTETPDNLYQAALNEEGGLTLLPKSKADKNQTVTVVEPRIERNGFVVCKRK